MSKDPGTHGRKLYFLFAKDDADYLWNAARRVLPSPEAVNPYRAPVGQALVKESFHPTRVAPTDATALLLDGPQGRDIPAEYARDESGDLYRTGTPAELFIMLKTDPATPGTDQGWVYATTTPDGRTILDAGRIGSCMGCHRENTQDRQFGPRWAWPKQTDTPKP